MNVLTFEQKAEYVARLLHLSRSGKLGWAAVSEHSFTVHLGRSFVELLARDEDDVHPYLLQIFRADGTLLTQVSSEDRPDPAAPNDALEERFLLELGRLYADAKRRALRIDEAVAEVFADLDDLDTP